MGGVESQMSQFRVLLPPCCQWGSCEIASRCFQWSHGKKPLWNKTRNLTQTLRLRTEIPEMATAVATTELNVLFPEPEINVRNPDTQYFAVISHSFAIPW